MAKILVTVTNFNERCADAKQFMEKNGHEVIVTDQKLRTLAPEQNRAIVGDIDAVISGMDNWNEQMFALAPKVKIIAKFGVGVDTIDLGKAKERGIKVINAAGANAHAVAEVTLWLMISVLRNAAGLHDRLRNGSWTRFLGTEMAGKTVGLIGFGQIARRVARVAHAFDAKVIAYKRHPDQVLAKDYGVTLMDRDDVIAGCDILSLHIPGSDDNIHMMNDQTFGLMRRGSCLINTGRGCLVDEAALLRAVESGRLAGAGLDVFEKEPLPKESPLLRNEKIICLPHDGGETIEAYKKTGLSVARGVVDALAGKIPDHWVNP